MSDVTILGADRAPSPGSGLGFGIDVGGTGVKGAIVDLRTGQFVGDRHRIDTPQPATPDLIAATVAEIVEHFGWTGPVGVTLPGIVKDGVVRSAANIDPGWIGTDARAFFSGVLGGRGVAVLNDADAAGLAEQRYGGGAAVDEGLVILLTLGTGIGSALIYDGVLIPNSELGHIEVGGVIAEKRASAKVRKDRDWSYEHWAGKLSRVLTMYERLFSPDLFVVGGGISRKADKWIPYLTNEVPVVPAHLRNTAGIVGAAMAIAGDR
ncbi:polyphosphate--glucose phosphotransferase [Gordonia sp. (in: high G+C Gram-positive bacteria)]|uniref:polyphosphate--glucose phosphotransferase n=1 Tax=Gordonia sp. (in: high G+C Gram-positive bacteria) TaxID=84139 RepID=UPI0035287E90